ncbi:hypothetical protein NP493_1318g00013 [Ridgeia piscesae]|uniref:Uncharacterized protein n=1 Tax=Ridgeia piscesae TaxID=27915 RepID=A0AAD9K9E7_RIDPI|nr:hypothetical protein NP493_1318g00013 [Ridgeia piscesae]
MACLELLNTTRFPFVTVIQLWRINYSLIDNLHFTIFLGRLCWRMPDNTITYNTSLQMYALVVLSMKVGLR